MDPSNNNSFGSPQAPGAIVSDGNTAVDNTAMNNTSGGFTSTNFPAGGITVGESSGKGPRKGLIIGVIVAFVLLLGGGLVALAATSGMFGGGNSSGNSQEENTLTDAKGAFNEYINYVVSGKDSGDAINEETISNMFYPYFAELNDEDLDVYLDKIKKKSDALAKFLGEEYALELRDMNVYTLWFAEAYPINYAKAYGLFAANGYEKAIESVNNHFEVDSEDGVFDQYLVTARKAAMQEISVISEANSAGCYTDGKLISGCYSMSDEKRNEYNTVRNEEAEIEAMIKENAVDAALVVYDSLYNNAETNNNE